ncbi:pyridoxamine 5'-phosphate oxidase family protein [Jannaschia sp. CCS1]|uniref:pyridoxamine 5'-phosphate oxidase family protein n=1 Tax=Jannaschia sp. (strain CCS1) TaxID=290400 RepID=UPI000053DB9B|nr:pyridoxamine 5'-phosphate oxidase family protein [Jannaschia sp. CCS1]ABD56651.1 pyridoxamine 5'-phosphate oxidase-related FMN-binding protein [Jannaschia sp. CCS1]
MTDTTAPMPPNPDDFYTPDMRKLQEEMQTRRLADAVVQAIVREELLPEMAGFISTLDYFFLSTVNKDGEPTVSYKGGNPGFAQVVTPKKIVFPSYNGNGMYVSAGNVKGAGKVGLLFIDMCTPLRVRVQGSATLTQTENYMKMYPGAEFIYEVDVDKAFYNCARYIHKHTRVEQTNRYVPDAKGDAPFPAWKRIDMLQPFLHPDDIGKADTAGGTITEDDYAQKVMEGKS